MTHDDLIALEHANWIGYLTGVVSCTGRVAVTRTAGVVTILTGLPMDWFNQVLIEHDDAKSAAVLAAVSAARDWGGEFVVRLRLGNDDRFTSTLIQAGLKPAAGEPPTPGMIAFPIDPDAMGRQATAELDIRRVTDDAGLDAHRHVVTMGFGSDPSVAAGSTCPDLISRPECVVYVGYAKGEPVASAMAWRTGPTVGVYSIATVESARRRGFGAAMTARVVSDGVRAGCSAAALQASEIGRPIYVRLGFRTVVEYIAYSDRG